MYADQVYRLPQSTYNNTASVDPNGVNIGSIWTYGVGLYASPQTNIMEWDFGEMYGGMNPYQSSNVGEHCANAGGGFGCKNGQLYYTNRTAGWDPTTYHHYGYLSVVDTAGHYEQCSYLDGHAATYDSQNGCLSDTFYNGSSNSALSSKNQLLFWLGAGAPTDSCGGPTCQTPTGNVDMYIQQVVIWTCNLPTSNGCAVAHVPSSPP